MSHRFRLLQAREADEPVRVEEQIAFAARLGCSPDAIEPFDLLQGRCPVDEIVEGVDAVLVGGSGRFSVLDDAPWLPPFVEAMGGLADRQFPTFASCFGFQALVLALGGTVITDADHSEVGTYAITLTEAGRADPLFAQMPETFDAQLGHKDRATEAPPGAIHLAGSERCPVQAIRVGERVYATQFHPELTDADNRHRFMRYLAEYQTSLHREDLSLEHMPSWPSPHADALLGRFAALVLGPAGA